MPVKLDQLLLNYDQSAIDLLLYRIVINWEILLAEFSSPGRAPRGETRRTFDRMKYRAEQAGKEVVVNGDILSIPWKTVISSWLADLQAYSVL